MGDSKETEYKNNFKREKYDSVNITFPKGQKAIIEAYWKSKGYRSLNSYINDVIRRDMEQSGGGKSLGGAFLRTICRSAA